MTIVVVKHHSLMFTTACVAMGVKQQRDESLGKENELFCFLFIIIIFFKL